MTNEPSPTSDPNEPTKPLSEAASETTIESTPPAETSDAQPASPEQPATADGADAQAESASTETVAPAEKTTAAPAAAESATTQDSAATGRRLQIGSERDIEPVYEKMNDAGEMEAIVSVKPPRKTGPVAVPRKGDVDTELDDVMSGASIDDLMTNDAEKQDASELEEDARRRAIVLRTHGGDVFVSLGVQHEGVASLSQFKEPPKPGDTFDVIVSGLNAADGLYEVRIPGATTAVSDWEDIAEGAVIEAKISGSNTGGLECMVGSIRGFIPASQIAIHRVENFGDYVGQKLACVVTEANPVRNNLVLSHRSILEREQEEVRGKLLEEIAVGDTREGTVRSLQKFGAFVDIGGLEGLVHISKMSWDRIEHPQEVFEVGQKVKVKVEKIDKSTGKIGLSYRDLLEDPWDNVVSKYPVNSTVQGVVSRVAQFGAFVKLEPGVEGLVHVTELAHHRVQSVRSYCSEGAEVEAKVMSVDREAQRIGLSLKALRAEPVDKSKKAKEEEPEEVSRELAVPKRDEPLKGGRDNPSGGEQFGLNW